MSLEQYLIPYIGSAGYFKVQTPFETPANVRFTCQSVRRISEYVSSNEDPWELIYEPRGQTQDQYDEDAALDMPIVGLQSDQGYWHYFPVRCMLEYPDPNGVPYRGMGLYINLPALPVSRDLTFLQAEITALIEDSLGVDCLVELVETSPVALVPQTNHDAETVSRQLRIQSRATPYARIRTLETEKAALQTKLTTVEQYVKDNM